MLTLQLDCLKTGPTKTGIIDPTDHALNLGTTATGTTIIINSFFHSAPSTHPVAYGLL
jgi:hypothetical protein